MSAHLQFTADEDVTQKLFKMEQQNLRLIEQNKQLARASGRATRTAKGGWDNATVAIRGNVASLARMAAGYLSVHSAIMAVIAADKDREEQMRHSNDQIVTQADAQRNMLRNLGNVSDAEQQQFLGRLEKITTRTSPKGGLKTVYEMAGAGLSASSANRGKTVAAVETALEFAPDDPQTATSITGAMLDLSKATGRTKMKENLGFLKIAGEQSRITSWEKIARNASTAIVNTTSFGASAQEALALYATMTQRMPDPMGEMSGTATIALAQQLEEFLPTENVYGQIAIPGRKGKTRGVVTKGTGLKTLDERLKYLWTHPLEKERFISDLKLEKKALGAAKDLLSGPKTESGLAYSSALAAANIPFEKMAEQAQTKIDQMNLEYKQTIASGRRASDVENETVSTTTDLGKEAAIQAAFTSDELDKMLAKRYEGWTARQIYWTKYKARRITQTPEEAFYNTAYGGAESNLMTGRPDIAELIVQGLVTRLTKAQSQWSALDRPDEVTRIEEQLEKLNALMERIESHNERIENNTRRNSEGTDKIEQNTRGPKPAAVQENLRQHSE